MPATILLFLNFLLFNYSTGIAFAYGVDQIPYLAYGSILLIPAISIWALVIWTGYLTSRGFLMRSIHNYRYLEENPEVYDPTFDLLLIGLLSLLPIVALISITNLVPLFLGVTTPMYSYILFAMTGIATFNLGYIWGSETSAELRYAR